MYSEITLIIYNVETGREERIKVDARRFSIGRSTENELVIEDARLSRRHALIESFDGAAQISDCGSQNGTFVNGEPIVGAVELKDGDLITLGGPQEITVEVRQHSVAGTGTGYASSPSRIQAPGTNAFLPFDKGAAPAGPPFPFNPQVIAGGAAILILLVAGLLLAFNRKPTPGPSQRPNAAITQEQDSPAAQDQGSSVTSTPELEPARDQEGPANIDTNVNPDSAELKMIEKKILIVMSSVSNDSRPFVPSDVVRQVSEKITKYRGSSFLRDEMRVMKQRGIPQLAAAAKSNDLKPALLVLAALARMDRDGLRGDPVTTAEAILPTLAKLRIIFGTELANDSLLVIATCDQPPSGNFHPLQLTISKLANAQPESVSKIRTVWYLYDHQKINAQAYELVLRFLAIGVVAQDPQHFGVDAEPLSF